MNIDAMTNVRYMVNDVGEAVDFYTKHFGFEPTGPSSPAFASVARDSLRLMLSGPESSAGRPMPDGARPGPGGWNRIHFHTSDLDAEIVRLKAEGVHPMRVAEPYEEEEVRFPFAVSSWRAP